MYCIHVLKRKSEQKVINDWLFVFWSRCCIHLVIVQNTNFLIESAYIRERRQPRYLVVGVFFLNGGLVPTCACSILIFVIFAPHWDLLFLMKRGASNSLVPSSKIFSFLRARWVKPNSTITYDSLPLSHGSGSFDMVRGEWRCEVRSKFWISWHVWFNMWYV